MKLVDFHCDTLLRIQEEESKSLKSLLKKNPWHVDLEKLKKADSLIQVFAIFLPPAHELTQKWNGKKP
jgi:membrane dipeptidase